MKAIAPGKLILSGEYAVVFGRPALAMAIDRSAVAEVRAEADRGDRGVTFDLPGVNAHERYTVRALRALQRRVTKNYRLFLDGQLGIREVLRKPIELFQFGFIMVLDGLHLKLGEALNLRVDSTIPIGCGLGSSAASVLSALRAVGHYFRVDFRPDWYYEYSLEAERMQHGFPSGVDSYISLHGGCARFQDGRAERIPLPRTPITLVDTGAPSTTTGQGVEQVRIRHGASRIWDDFAGVTRAMEAALASNDPEAIRAAIRENHRLLRAIGVVPDRVAAFAREVEACGGAAKVCGAGAIAGDAAGIVLVSADALPPDLYARFGYTPLPVRGEPLGVRLV